MRSAERQWAQILAADAFAALTAGPSYACACSCSRLDPGRADAMTARRAEVVLASLERAVGGGQAHALRGTAAADLGPRRSPCCSGPVYALQQVDRDLIDAVDDQLAGQQFPFDHWLSVVDPIAVQLAAGDASAVVLPPSADVRHVLNAAWLGRLQRSGDPDRLRGRRSPGLPRQDRPDGRGQGRPRRDTESRRPMTDRRAVDDILRLDDRATAWRRCSELLEQAPTPTDAAVIVDALGDRSFVEEAIAATDRCLRRFGADAGILQRRARLLESTGRELEASEAEAWAAALEGTQRAFGLLQRSGPEETIAAIDNALATDEDTVVDVARGAFELWQRGDLEEAIEAIDGVLDRHPDNHVVRLARAQMHIVLDHHEHAADDLMFVVQAEPSNVDALQQLGESLRRLERYPEALEVLDRALAIEPDDAWTIGTKAQVLAALDRLEEGADLFAEARELDTSMMTWIHEGEASVLRRLARYEEAIAAADRAGPDSRPAMSEKAESLRLLGRNELALAVLDETIDRHGPTAFLVGTRGQVRAALGDQEGAIADLLEALEPRAGHRRGPPTRSPTPTAHGAVRESLEVADTAARTRSPRPAEPRRAGRIAAASGPDRRGDRRGHLCSPHGP